MTRTCCPTVEGKHHKSSCFNRWADTEAVQPATVLYSVVGTYPDGQTRRWHMTTRQTPEEVIAEYTSGLLAFASVTVEPCTDLWTCSHGVTA